MSEELVVNNVQEFIKDFEKLYNDNEGIDRKVIYKAFEGTTFTLEQQKAIF